jgi:divalent metal cation (Fe/Co/Zn/Cd) transporter
VLGLSALFDGTTWWLALRNFKGERRYADLLGAVRESKDPPSFIVLFEDSAALVGIVVALAGSFLSVQLEMPILDGIASIVIALVLATTAAILATETKGLLIGERADPAIAASIQRIAGEIDGIANANGILTVQLAPNEIVVALSLEFDDALRTPEIESKVRELEHEVRAAHREVTLLFVKPQSVAGFKESVRRAQEPESPPLPR